MELNFEQKKAVEHVEGPCLVLAGAGSGKTRVVTHRIANLIDLGILPSDIVALTFTNKAADEMRRRVQVMQGKDVLASTFHSLGARILRESISSLGYQPDFAILDGDDSEKLLKSCFELLKVKEEKGLVKKVRILISNSKNELLSPDEIVKDSMPSPAEKAFYDIYPLYQKKLQDLNACDFDDLLYLTVKMLQQNEELAKEYQQRWLFILIDEYQDTNFAQYHLIKLLSKAHQNIFAVGDPDQSIYSWRGARYENILHFEKDFPGALVITLDQNYRSTNLILHAANDLISHNEKRFDKSLWSALGEGEKIQLFVGHSEKEEANFILERIIDHRKKDKITLNEMVIFYRTNAQSRVFEDILLKHNLPYRIIGGISFYQRKEIKDLLAYLKLVTSPFDFLSFARTLPITTKGIGQTTIKKLIEQADKSQLPILQMCKGELPIRFNSSQKENLKKYVALIEHLKKEALSQQSIAQLIEYIIQETGYNDYLQQDPATYEDRKENIEALISKAAEWEEEAQECSLALFLEEVSLKPLKENHREDELTLMTLHNGKGLEFELVFMTGMEENLLPHVNALDSLAGLEEERRLCYVGMTRAKKLLYLSASYLHYIWGSQRIMNLSRFIGEIPSEYLYHWQDEKETKFVMATDEHAILQVGARVRHKEFGQGVIEKAYHTSYGLTYDVLFAGGNTKRTLVAKYAKLELC